MKNRFKKIWITSSIFSMAFVTPFVVTSCSNLPKGDISKQEQTTTLESEAAKITVLDSWLTTTYTSLYTAQLKPNASDIDKEKITNSFRYYLDYLDWPQSEKGNLVGSDIEVYFAITPNLLSEDEKNKFKQNIEEAYKFYVSFMSTIQSSSSGSSDSNSSIQPKVYFKVKATEWKKKKYNVWAPIKSTSGEELTITNFNPGLSYTGYDTNGLIQDDFKILMSTRGTLVYQNVMKLLLSEMYFLHATENQIKNGTNFNKMTKNPSSVNYINTMSFVDHSTTETNKFNTFLLKKYMVEKSPTFKWSYSSDDYTTTVSTSGLISTINEFNNLSTTLDTKLSEAIVPNSNETTMNNLSNLEAYNKFEINSESSSDTELTEDLVKDMDSIKLFGSPKIGLLDTKTNKLFTFSDFEAIKGAISHNNDNSQTTKLSIPSINVKKESKNENSHSLSIENLEVAWNNTIVEPINNNEFKNENSGVVQTLIINSIGYKPSETNAQKVTISFTYKYKINSGTEKSFNYSFVLENWSQKEQDQNNIFSEGYTFSGDPNKVGIEIFDISDGNVKPKGVTYYLRALPIFEKFTDKGQIYIGKNWYMRGQFTFKNTPWNIENEQRKLIYFFMLSDSSLFNSIKDFYLFNDFNVEGSVSELTSQISSLGLSKKTKDDRKNAGII